MISQAIMRLERHRQAIKWLVYGLLFINLSVYVMEDWQSFSRSNTFTLITLAAAFATSLDTSAWFGLLVVFEIETYRQQLYRRPPVRLLLNGLRSACFGVLAHTLMVYSLDLLAVINAPTPLVSSLCMLPMAENYYLFNQQYQLITHSSCQDLSLIPGPLYSPEPNVFVDGRGLSIARVQAAISVIECAAWLLAGFAIAAQAYLKRRAQYSALVTVGLEKITHYSYLAIIACALTWAWYGHFLYTYDSLLWLGGFAMIEANLSAWESYLRQKRRQTRL